MNIIFFKISLFRDFREWFITFLKLKMVVFLKILVTLFASVYGLDNGVARTPPSESIGTLFITHYNNPTLVYVMIYMLFGIHSGMGSLGEVCM